MITNNEKLLTACEAVLQMPVACTTDDEVRSNVVRREYLRNVIVTTRAQAEDDAMPVDEAWLESIGQKSRQGFLILEEFYAQWDNGEFMLGGFVTSNPVGWSLEGKTRGHVRQLLEALGGLHATQG